MSLWGAILGHANLVYHAAGWQEGGLTASFEKLILDVEMLQLMMHFLEPVQHAFYEPLVSNWQSYENWQIAGGKDATERATDIWKRALAEYEEPALDPAIVEALDDYMARRRTEIGDGEP